MGSGGPGRGQGRRSNISKVDNSTTPSIHTYFTSKTPMQRDSSASSSSSEENNNKPDPASPLVINMDEEDDEDEELENLNAFSAFNTVLQDLLVEDDDNALQDDASVDMGLPAIQAVLAEEDNLPKESIIASYITSIREKIRVDGLSLNPRYKNGVNCIYPEKGLLSLFKRGNGEVLQPGVCYLPVVMYFNPWA